MNKSLTVFLIFLLFLSLSLWFIGNQYSLARNQATHYVNFGVKWSHMGFFELDYTGSMWINGKIRVGENVSIAILHFSMTNINIEILDRVGLAFRIFLNQEADYPNRSKAITIETYHVFNSGQTLNSELYVMFNETLKYGNETVKITPGEELSLKGLYEFDITRYFKNGDILTIPRQAGGGTETIIVENSLNPLLMFFLESIAEKLGQAGVVIVLLTLGATAIIKRKRNR